VILGFSTVLFDVGGGFDFGGDFDFGSSFGSNFGGGGGGGGGGSFTDSYAPYSKIDYINLDIWG
jgi:hypothetical protein